jgi:hypothetical protein
MFMIIQGLYLQLLIILTNNLIFIFYCRKSYARLYIFSYISCQLVANGQN